MRAVQLHARTEWRRHAVEQRQAIARFVWNHGDIAGLATTVSQASALLLAVGSFEAEEMTCSGCWTCRTGSAAPR